MQIWFDMDGTIADLYGVDNWLDYLLNENPYPYKAAKPLVNMSRLAKALKKLQRNGNEVGIISWTSKGGTETYNEEVSETKKGWLKSTSITSKPLNRRVMNWSRCTRSSQISKRSSQAHIMERSVCICSCTLTNSASVSTAGTMVQAFLKGC